MTYLNDIANPPNKDPSKEQSYRFSNDVNTINQALFFIMNPSVVTNANFATLGVNGVLPVTQAAGDGAEISAGWNVFGAANATYVMQSTAYPTNSLIQSASLYYEHVTVSAHNGGAFYIYQRQNVTVRKYQDNFFTFGFLIKNNQTKAIKVKAEIFSHYDGSTDKSVLGKAIYLQPGVNKISSLIETQSLSGLTVGAGSYTDFRLNFVDLYDGTADIEIYQIKCEFGKISTLLQQ
jgi:hypothetical protein